MGLFLLIVSGICWMTVYIESIRLGIRQKTYAMPFFALALNLTWEGLYAYIYLTQKPPEGIDWFIPQGIICLMWVIFDVVILYTFYKYGKREFSSHSTEKAFIPYSILVLVMAMAAQIAFYLQFKMEGPLYSAFVQNLIMSIAYIDMIQTRKSSKGQNMNIAICKFVGTLCATISCGILYSFILALVLGIFVAIFDIIYIERLRKTIIREKRAIKIV